MVAGARNCGIDGLETPSRPNSNLHLPNRSSMVFRPRATGSAPPTSQENCHPHQVRRASATPTSSTHVEREALKDALHEANEKAKLAEARWDEVK